MQNNLDNLLDQADALVLLNDCDKAETLYKKVLEMGPDNFHACYKLGLIYAGKECLHEAIKMLVRATEVNNGSLEKKEAWKKLGQLHQTMDKPDSALNAYRNALILDLTLSHVAISLTDILFRQKKYNKAGSVLTQALGVNRNDAALNYQMAGLLMYLGLYGVAKDYSKRAVAGSQGNKTYIMRHADILELMGEAEDAFYTLRPLLEDEDVHLDAVHTFAKISIVLGMKEQAIALLDYLTTRPCTDAEDKTITAIKDWLGNV